MKRLSEDQRKAVFAKKAGKAGKRKRTTLSKTRKGPSPKAGELPNLVSEWQRDLVEAGDDWPPVCGIAQRHMDTTTISNLRADSGKLGAAIARDLMAELDLGIDQAIVLGVKAVQGANVADRKAVLRHISLTADKRTWPSKGFQAGYNDALVMVGYAIVRGRTFETGIRNHREYRKVGDTFNDQHHDEAGFHAGAEAAYKDLLTTYRDAAEPQTKARSRRQAAEDHAREVLDDGDAPNLKEARKQARFELDGGAL